MLKNKILVKHHKNGRVFTVADVHGCFDTFMLLLDKISFNSSDTMYIIGDALDRGPNSIKLLLFIMKTPNIILLKGNHEVMFHDYFTRYPCFQTDYDLFSKSQYEPWLRQGGFEACKDLQAYQDVLKIETLTDYIASLPLIGVVTVGINKFYLAHASLNFEAGLISDYQVEDHILWKRHLRGDHNILADNTFLVTGHTPTVNLHSESKGKIFRDHSWFATDVGCFLDFGLACLCLNDLTEYYV